MKARVVTVQIQPSKLDESIRIFRDSVVPAASEYTGCHAVFLATDQSSGKGVSITIWDEQELQSSESSGYLQEQFGKFAGLFAAPPIREVYDVAFWERATADPASVRIVTVQFKPGQLDGGVAHYKDRVLPAAREQKGFLGAMLLTDPVTGKAVSATAWGSEEAMMGGQVKGGYLDQQISSMAQFFAAPPGLNNYAMAVRWVRQS